MIRKPATWIRKRVFALLCLIVAIAIAISYHSTYVDTAMVLYAAAIIFLTPVAVVMTYRGVQRGAVDMYWIVVLLVTGIIFSMVQQLYVRWHFCLGDQEAYLAIIQTDFWQHRSVVQVVVAAYLLAWVLGRTLGVRDNGYIIRPDDRVVYATQNGVDELVTGLDARIVAGELRFEEHTHEGLVIGAKLIVKIKGE